LFVSAGIVAFLFAIGTVAPLVGQTPQAIPQSPHSYNAATHGVAVVDISYIFKNHQRFTAAMKMMQEEMKAIEEKLKVAREQITKLEEEKNRLNVGTEPYRQLDDQLARKMADFNLEMGRIRKDFLDREAKEYYKTYLEIVDAVGQYATARNIGLVIRFNGEPVDPNRREDVLREINKPVVYQNRIDITPDVLGLLNRDAPRLGTQPGVGQPMIPR
jgi:Skp family chaperone for outer membrane proteins